MIIEVNKLSGTPEALARRVPPNTKFKRSLETVEITSPMLVLGSSQSEKYFNVQSLKNIIGDSIAVYRRSSGGGAVLAFPNSFFWFNVLIPIDDELYELNLTKSFNNLGSKLVNVLNRIYGLRRSALDDNKYLFEMRGSPLENTTVGKLWCFMDGNYGEIYRGGKKAIGISQRRNRYGSCYYVGINIENMFDEMDALTNYEMVESDFSEQFPDGFDFSGKIEVLSDLALSDFIALTVEEFNRDAN